MKSSSRSSAQILDLIPKRASGGENTNLTFYLALVLCGNVQKPASDASRTEPIACFETARLFVNFANTLAGVFASAQKCREYVGRVTATEQILRSFFHAGSAARRTKLVTMDALRVR